MLKTKNLPTLVFAYKTYIRPLLEYASEIWNGNLKTQSKQIEKIQKIFTRRALKICGTAYFPYSKRLEICQLQKLSTRRSLIDLTTSFKIIMGYTHLSPHHYYSFTPSNRRRLLTIQMRKHTIKTRQNFFVRTIKAWNKISASLINSKTPTIFRKNLKLSTVPSTTRFE